MKFNTSYKYIILVTFIITGLTMCFINLNNKERLLKNQIKVIENLEYKNQIKKNNNQNLVVDMKSFIEKFAMINCIKSNKLNENELEVQVEFTGDTNLIQQNLKNLNTKNINLNINSINISKIDENTIDCRFDAKTK